MSAEQKGEFINNVGQKLTDAAAIGVRIGKLVLFRSAYMLAKDVATPADLVGFIPEQRQPEMPPLAVEVLQRRARVLENCRLAFDFAIRTDMDSEDTFIRCVAGGPNKSEYIGVESPKQNPLTLHRPTIFNHGKGRYAYWMREKVATTELNLDLPSHYYREFGIDAQGNIEEKVLVGPETAEYRILDDFESLPYLRALTPVRIQKMVMTDTAPSQAES